MNQITEEFYNVYSDNSTIEWENSDVMFDIYNLLLEHDWDMGDTYPGTVDDDIRILTAANMAAKTEDEIFYVYKPLALVHILCKYINDHNLRAGADGSIIYLETDSCGQHSYHDYGGYSAIAELERLNIGLPDMVWCGIPHLFKAQAALVNKRLQRAIAIVTNSCIRESQVFGLVSPDRY